MERILWSLDKTAMTASAISYMSKAMIEMAGSDHGIEGEANFQSQLQYRWP